MESTQEALAQGDDEQGLREAAVTGSLSSSFSSSHFRPVLFHIKDF